MLVRRNPSAKTIISLRVLDDAKGIHAQGEVAYEEEKSPKLASRFISKHTPIEEKKLAKEDRTS
jgi:hypothetical protein